MYKIIKELPDDISEENIEEKYSEFCPCYYVDVMAFRGGESVESIENKLKDNFQNLPKDYIYSDIILVSKSDLLEDGSYFLKPSKKFHIKFLYDEENKKYYKLKYKIF